MVLSNVWNPNYSESIKILNEKRGETEFFGLTTKDTRRFSKRKWNQYQEANCEIRTLPKYKSCFLLRWRQNKTTQRSKAEKFGLAKKDTRS